MFGGLEVKRTNVAGRYAATGEFSMAGHGGFRSMGWVCRARLSHLPGAVQ